MTNIYELITKQKYDKYALYKNYFILQPHQVIPKYYLLGNEKINTLLLSYSMGSGKSLCAVFLLLEVYNRIRKTTKLSEFMPHVTFPKDLGKIFVIGAWQTQTQIKIEMMRPEFSIVSSTIIENIKELMISPIQEQRTLGEEIRSKIINQFGKDISFVGYQHFFNLLFPNISEQKFNQEAEILKEKYINGELKISSEFLSQLRNSVIIIDEMQHLYSISGLNSYGFAVSCISRIAKEYNVKLLFMTGTIFNSSMVEITEILNIVVPKPDKWFTKEDWCRQEIISDDMNIWRMIPEKIYESIELLNSRFIYYEQRGEISPAKLVDINKVNIFTPDISKEMSVLIYDKKPNLPQEYHIGNKLIYTEGSKAPWMILYSVVLQGIQAEKYKSYIASNSDNSSELLSDSQANIFLHDAFVPKTVDIYEVDGVYMGNFLDINKIREYSALGYELYYICLQNAERNEKTIVYHNRLNNFGIKQYAEILRYNGFVQYGKTPSQNSICKRCNNTFESHSFDIVTRNKRNICSSFIAIQYDLLTGDIGQSQRDDLTNNVFNNPKNLYGDMISVLFVSDVAYSGVSFLNTTNLVVLSRIPNISKWRQIYARIVRTRSHALLPEKMHYAKIYTMVIEHPSEVDSKELSLSEKYYSMRAYLHADIETYMKKLSEECIGNTLLNHPENYKFTKNENEIVSNIYNNDMKDQINLILQRILGDVNTRSWTLDVLIDRIQNSKLSVSFLDLSFVDRKVLSGYILNSSFITSNIINNEIYITLAGSNIKRTSEYNSFLFSEIRALQPKKANLTSLINKLSKETTFAGISMMLTKVMKLLENDLSQSVTFPPIISQNYALGNEYYDGDERDFIVNHSNKNRSRGTMAGFYYDRQIIKLDGSIINITDVQYLDVPGVEDIPYIFKISSIKKTASSPFFLHVGIITKSTTVHIDRRFQSRGRMCSSISDLKPLMKIFPQINRKLWKKEFCKEMINASCDLQLKYPDNKLVITPFERMK